MHSDTLFSFIHCADLHLDSPFEGFQAVAPEIARVLWDATFQAYNRVIELAVAHRVDFIIVAGDVYDGADRSLRAQLRFRDGLLRAREAGIRVLVAHGNHDPLSGWEAGLTLPDNVHRFGGGQVDCVSFQRGGEVLARIYGISYPVREVAENLTPRFPRPDPGPFAIGVLHCNVGADPAYDNYAPCTLADLTAAGMDYWALGHVHSRRVVREERPWVVYPGNTQGRSVREGGARGCYEVRVDAAGRAHLEFWPTDAVRWFQEEVAIGGLDTLDGLIEELARRKEEVRGQAEGRGAVWRLTLTGRGELHGELRRRNLEQDLAASLREHEGEREDFVWVESLSDSSRPALDVEERSRVPDFVGDFLRAAKGLRQAEDPGEAVRQILAARKEYRSAAVELERWSDDELLRLVEDAETLGLDLLLPED